MGGIPLNLTKYDFQMLLVYTFNNITNFNVDGALGLGLLDNFYNNELQKHNIEFFEDFDDGNKPVNKF